MTALPVTLLAVVLFSQPVVITVAAAMEALP